MNNEPKEVAKEFLYAIPYYMNNDTKIKKLKTLKILVNKDLLFHHNNIDKILLDTYKEIRISELYNI